ncbi:hypothetical protein OROGR_031909 [Orobanche gracilis]
MILDPVPARSKGRPPSKRKTSKVEQIVKKKFVGKKAQKKDLCISKVQEIENERFTGSQIVDAVDTQESIQNGQSYFWRNEHGPINNLAPFNPNQVHIGEVPYYSQTTNHNVSFFQLLQAQHHADSRVLGSDDLITIKP